jgi:hypothetical protein
VVEDHGRVEEVVAVLPVAALVQTGHVRSVERPGVLAILHKIPLLLTEQLHQYRQTAPMAP